MASFRSHAATDPGHVRRRNEDAVFADDALGVYFVVDGMGGQNAGHVASQIASQTLKARLERKTGTPERRIREAIALANNAVYEDAQRNAEHAGMGCVLTVAVLENGVLHFGHVGDTRLYRIHNGEIRKLTQDHSPVGELEDSGQIGESEAMEHPRRNEVFRDAGSAMRDPDDEFFIQVGAEPAEADSAFLLCSDGLTDVVTQGRIREIVQQSAGNPGMVTGRLIDAANENSKDNVSAVYVEGQRFAADSTVQWRPPQPSGGLLRLSAVALVALLVGFVAAWMLRPGPRTIEVGPGGIASIAQALDKAHSGDTVHVAPGDYAEKIELKSGVTLVGEQAVLVAAPGAAEPVIVADGVSQARVEGLQIRSDGTYAVGIRVHDSSVDLARLRISHADKGVVFSGKSKGRLYASAFTANDIPVSVVDAASPVIEYLALDFNKAGIQWLSSKPQPQPEGAKQ
ncbi:MAG: protein phosphatase 2C domain-containing protein [Acidobacteria bacterium]|nr:protein phosphatase 2C domain-containing protein [Acidobacteriota bacterium]